MQPHIANTHRAVVDRAFELEAALQELWQADGAALCEDVESLQELVEGDAARALVLDTREGQIDVRASDSLPEHLAVCTVLGKPRAVHLSPLLAMVSKVGKRCKLCLELILTLDAKLAPQLVPLACMHSV